MFNSWRVVFRPHHGDDVKTDFQIYMLIFDKVVGSLLKMNNLLVVNSHFRISIQAVASGFHFNNNECLTI